MILGIIPCLMYASLIVYIANLSLLFVNYLGVKQNQVGYYQGIIMFTFLLFSFLSAMLLTQFSIKTMQKMSLAIILLASIFLFLNNFIFTNPVSISLIMSLYSVGSAIALGPFISQALNVFPELRGTSSALFGAIRLALSSVAISIAGYLFNGSLMPIAVIILAMTGISVVMYLYVRD